MASMFQGLLKTPEEIRAAEQKALEERGLTAAAMLTRGGQGTTALPGLLQGFGANIARNIDTNAANLVKRGLGGIAGLTGAAGNQQAQQVLQQAAMSPEERKAIQEQGIASGTDTNNIYSIKQAIERFRAMGNAEAVQVLQQRLEQLQQRNLDRAAAARQEQRVVAQEGRAAATEQREIEKHREWQRTTARNTEAQKVLDNAGIQFDYKNPLEYYKKAANTLTDAGYGVEATKYASKAAEIWQDQQDKIASKVYKVVPTYGSNADKNKFNSLSQQEQKARLAGNTAAADAIQAQMDQLDIQMAKWQKDTDIAKAGDDEAAKQKVERKYKQMGELDEQIKQTESDSQYLNDFYSQVMIPLENENLYVGPLANEQAKMTNVLTKFGLSNAEATQMASNTEAANSFLMESMVEAVKKLGANPTDADREFIREMTMQITKSPQAIRKMFRYLELRQKEQAQMLQDKRDWIREGKDPADFEVQRIQELEDMRKEAKSSQVNQGFFVPMTQVADTGKPIEFAGYKIWSDPTESVTPSELSNQLDLQNKSIKQVEDIINMQKEALVGTIQDPKRAQEDKANAWAKLMALRAVAKQYGM